MFRPIDPKQDLVELEHGVLALWQERRTFARLRAQLAGGPRWSFLDGPITANNPMGVHHAWGRAYKDLYQRFHAMLGHDQRWQNGFDCQGLWVEVNVERDLGFTSKRDIEAYGIADFVSLCKQRVLTYAARQTEQSQRLGMWMDWNDPDELRRLRDLLAEDPGAAGDDRGRGRPGHRHGRDARRAARRAGRRRQLLHVQQREQRPDLGLPRRVQSPRLDLPRPRLDAVVSPLRDRVVADGDERGLRGPRGSRADDQAPAARPAGRVTARVDHDAMDARRERRRGRGSGPALRPDPAGRRGVLGRPRACSRRRSSASSGSRRRNPAASSSAGATRARSTTCPPSARRSGTRPTSTGSCRGTRSARTRARASSTSRRAPAPRTTSSASRSGCPAIGPIDEDGRYVDGFGWLSGKEAPNVAQAIVDDLERRGRFYHLEPYTHRYPHCWRCSTPLLFRLVDEWFISMGPVYDKPRSELTPEEVDASLRYQIMEVVDRIRWIPSFGYERELDWLLNMHDWMISKKRYWGLALPIYDCRKCGSFDVIGGREELRERAIAGWDAFEGHTPHRPFVDEVTIACSSCGEPVSRIPDVGNPWLDAGIVPFSTLHYREDPEYWKQWFPADFITESFPGQFRNWFYSMLAMSTVLKRTEPYRTIFGYALVFGEDGRPDAQELGQRDRVRRGRRADGRRRHALAVRQGTPRGQHQLRLARRRRGAPRAADPVERLRVLRHVRAARRLGSRARDRRGSGRGRIVAGARPLDPVSLGRRWRRRSAISSTTTTRSRRHVR